MEGKGKYNKEDIKIPLEPRRGVRGRGSIGPVEKPKNFKKTLFRLWKYFGSERRLLVIIFMFVIIDSIIGLLGPYLIGKSIDAMSELKGKVDFNLLSVMVILLLVTYILDGILTFFQGWLMAGTAQKIVMNLRRSLFDKLQKLPISFFDTNTHGEIMSRLTNDIENVSSTISQSTTQLMSAVVTRFWDLLL